MKYELGGQEVPREASEAISEISQNRTLVLQKMTADAPFVPEITEGLKTVDEVFEHFQPKVDVNFETSEGTEKDETLNFSNLGDFTQKGLIAQSDFLQGLNSQKEDGLKFLKQLKSNKILNAVLNNPEAKSAYIDALQTMLAELEASEA